MCSLCSWFRVWEKVNPGQRGKKITLLCEVGLSATHFDPCEAQKSMDFQLTVALQEMLSPWTPLKRFIFTAGGILFYWNVPTNVFFCVGVIELKSLFCWFKALFPSFMTLFLSSLPRAPGDVVAVPVSSGSWLFWCFHSLFHFLQNIYLQEPFAHLLNMLSQMVSFLANRLSLCLQRITDLTQISTPLLLDLFLHGLILNTHLFSRNQWAPQVLVFTYSGKRAAIKRLHTKTWCSSLFSLVFAPQCTYILS